MSLKKLHEFYSTHWCRISGFINRWAVRLVAVGFLVLFAGIAYGLLSAMLGEG